MIATLVKTQLRTHRALIIQFLKFGVVGTIGFLVDAGILQLNISLFKLDPYTGRVISFLIAASVTWICNRLFTFKGLGSGHAGVQWARFITVCSGGFAINYGTYALLVATLPLVHEHLILGVAVGSIMAMFFNFFAARRLVFR